MAYNKHEQKSCCLGSLGSDFKESNQLASANIIATRICSSLTDEIFSRVMFANTIMTEEKIRKGDQYIRYKLKQWKNGSFDILNNISKYVTLVQLMDSVGNMNIAVSVVCKRIFD